MVDANPTARARRRRRPTKHGCARFGENTPEYQAWLSMKGRCYCRKHASYPNYGGRGITVCVRWLHSFENFLADMGPKPAPDFTLDRINNEVGYEPSNCRWVPAADQRRNTRRNVFLTFNGETHCLSEWARIIGVPQKTLDNRIKHGWPVERALTTPRCR